MVSLPHSKLILSFNGIVSQLGGNNKRAFFGRLLEILFLPGITQKDYI